MYKNIPGSQVPEIKKDSGKCCLKLTKEKSNFWLNGMHPWNSFYLIIFTNVLNGFSKEATLILGLFYLWTKFFDSK